MNKTYCNYGTDDIISEIERRIKELKPFKTEDNLRAHGAIAGYYQILSFINTLETKEVGLKKEIASYIHDNTNNGYFRADIHDVAEYFFELGMQQSKKNDNNNEE